MPFSSLEALFSRTRSGIKPGLDLMQELVDALEHPEHSFLCVHIAGTNGKGSVCAMVESMLREAGFKTGLFTSPHLVKVNERIQIEGQPVSDHVLTNSLAAVESVEGSLERLPTFFETLTAMAFWAFRDAGVQIAVIETGLGGRLDSTNVIEPLVTGITRIDMDHQKFLGDTLSQIAGEKSGILKAGRPAVIGAQFPEALEVLLSRAKELECPVWNALDRIGISGRTTSLQGQKVTISTPDLDVGRVTLPLFGAYQMENVATAVSVVEAVFHALHADLSAAVIKKGLAKTVWPGRGQLLSTTPPVLLDVAHNPGGARALREMIQDLFGKKAKGVLIWSSLADKDPDAFLKILAPCVAEILCVEVQTPRALSVSSLIASAEKVGVPVASCSLDEARDIVTQRAAAQDFGCVAGSVYLAGEWLACQTPDPGERLC